MSPPPVTAQDLMTGAPAVLSPSATVAEALARLRRLRIHELPVVKDGRLVGLVTLDGIAQHTNLSLKAKVRNLLVLPPTVQPSTPWEEVAERLLASSLRALPVVGARQRVVGIVSRTDVVRALPSVSHLGGARAEEAASPLEPVVEERAPIGTVIGRVRDEPPLPVVDARGRLVGSLGVADLGQAFWRPKRAGKGDRPREVAGRGRVGPVEVRSIMRTPAVAVDEATPLVDVARRMESERVSSVFVLRDQVPTAVVTQTDLLETAVGGRPSGGPQGEVFVHLHGRALRHSRELMPDLDRVASQGLARIRRRVRPALLDLHLVPEGEQWNDHVSVNGRLHTDQGIFRASVTTWDSRQGLAQVLLQLERQAVRAVTRKRRPQRARRRVRRFRAEGR